MAFLTKDALRALLRKHDIRPRKHWGQNFLVSEKTLNNMLAVADITPKDTVLEIGGGVGALSLPLAERAAKLIVYERDPRLCEILRDRLKAFSNTEVRCEDARRISFNNLPHGYRIIANLPYSVGLPILRSALESNNPPASAHVMLQREVGERLLAEPPSRSLAGAAMQTLASMQRVFLIPPEATWPVPEVASIYLSLIPKTLPQEEKGRIIEAMKLGFKHPRKKVLSNVVSREHKVVLSKACAIPDDARAEELTDAQWTCVADWLAKNK